MADQLQGKRVTVMGLGRFGGGVGATRYLVEQGAHVTVSDRATADSLEESLNAIADLPLERVLLGRHDEADFRQADLVVASPAVPIHHPLLEIARAAGAIVTTEIGLFWTRCPARVIAVTGSVGKSTTAAMIHTILVAAGRKAWFGGNVGVSLLPEVNHIGAEDWVVLELSSFQLEYLAPLRPKPAIAIVTNFRPNHLDRHGTLEAYRAAKQTLLRWQDKTDVAVLNVGDSDVSDWPTNAKVWWFGRPADDPILGDRCSQYPSPNWQRSGRTPPATVSLSGDSAFLIHDGCEPGVIFLDLPAPGEHNRLNAAAAIAAAMAVGISPHAIPNALQSFRGLPDRLEVVGEFEGRLWVNDSKATTPEAAVVAMQAFQRPVHLIAGGANKGASFTAFAEEATRRTVGVYLSGETSPVLADLLGLWHHPAVTCSSFEESVIAAYRASNPGDVILLSPACASWGQFRDYRERGKAFTAIAKGTESKPLNSSERPSL